MSQPAAAAAARAALVVSVLAIFLAAPVAAQRSSVDCVLSPWTEWGGCCRNVQYRVRAINVPSSGKGDPCPSTSDLIESRKCFSLFCSTHSADCVVSKWGSYTSCSATCGGGSQHRGRKIEQNGVGLGQPCPLLEETRSCGTEPCSRDCEYRYVNEGACSASCGGGKQLQVLQVTAPAVGDGKPCPTAESITVPCNTDVTCPPPACEAGPWSAFGECSQSCGSSGVKTRQRQLLQGTTTTCPNLYLVEQVRCTLPRCDRACAADKDCAVFDSDCHSYRCEPDSSECEPVWTGSPTVYSPPALGGAAPPWPLPCLPTTNCSASQYQATPATPTTDRVCKALTVCNPATEYVATPPTPTSNRVCAPREFGPKFQRDSYINETALASLSTDDKLFKLVATTSAGPVVFSSSPTNEHIALDSESGWLVARGPLWPHDGQILRFNATAADSRATCNGLPGPCTSTVAVAVRIVGITSCPADQFVTVETVTGTDVAWAEPTLDVRLKGRLKKITGPDKPRGFFPVGTTRVEYLFSDGTVELTCAFQVNVVFASLLVVSDVGHVFSQFANETVMVDYVVDGSGLFGNTTAAPLVRTNLDRDGFTLALQGHAGMMLTVTPPAGSSTSMLVALKYCTQGGTADPEGDTVPLPANVAMEGLLPASLASTLVFTNTGSYVHADGSCFAVNGFLGPISTHVKFAALVITLPAGLLSGSSDGTRRRRSSMRRSAGFGTYYPSSSSLIAFNYTFFDDQQPEADPGSTVSTADIVPPIFDECPGEIVVEAPPGAYGVAVNWTVPTASDNVGITAFRRPTQQPPWFFTVAGSPHQLQYVASDGTSEVTCTVTVTVLFSAATRAITAELGQDSIGRVLQPPSPVNTVRAGDLLVHPAAGAFATFAADLETINVLRFVLHAPPGERFAVRQSPFSLSSRLEGDLRWALVGANLNDILPLAASGAVFAELEVYDLNGAVDSSSPITTTTTSPPTASTNTPSNATVTPTVAAINESSTTSVPTTNSTFSTPAPISSTPIPASESSWYPPSTVTRIAASPATSAYVSRDFVRVRWSSNVLPAGSSFTGLGLVVSFPGGLEDGAADDSTATSSTRRRRTEEAQLERRAVPLNYTLLDGSYFGASYLYSAAAARSLTAADLTGFFAIEDLVPPTFGDTCPADITVDTAPGQPGLQVFWDLPFASDDRQLNPARGSASHMPGDVFQLGPATTVRYEAFDLAGNRAVCEFVVLVLDNEPPVLECPLAPLSYAIPAGQPTLTLAPAMLAVNVSDNSGSVEGLLVQPSLPTQLGLNAATNNLHTIRVSTRDAAGNTAACEVTVLVRDEEAPYFDFCPPDITSSSTAVFFAQPRALDNQDSVFFSAVSHSSGDEFPVGDTVVQYTAVDGAGNEATCEFVVSVPASAVAGGDGSSGSSVPTGAWIALACGLVLLFLLILVIVVRRQRSLQRKAFDFRTMIQEVVSDAGMQRIGEDGLVVPREIPRANIQIIQKLGQGAFGEVNKALYRESSGKQGRYLVAVKTGNRSSADDLLREAALNAQFDHPNVICLEGVCTRSDPVMIVLEYAEHGSLNSFLSKYTVSEGMRRRFAGDIAAGLEYLSSENYVHRDVAARNVLISSDFTLKIADFGMSRNTDNNLYYQSRGGALPVRWSAPEAMEEHRFSSRSDIWAYGITLYEIWTNGSLPYKGWSNQRVWMEVTNGYRLPCPPTCHADVYTHMRGCWEHDPHKRPTFKQLRDFFRSTQDEFMVGDSAPVPNADTANSSAGSSLPSGISVNSNAASSQHAATCLTDASAPSHAANAISVASTTSEYLVPSPAASEAKPTQVVSVVDSIYSADESQNASAATTNNDTDNEGYLVPSEFGGSSSNANSSAGGHGSGVVLANGNGTPMARSATLRHNPAETQRDGDSSSPYLIPLANSHPPVKQNGSPIHSIGSSSFAPSATSSGSPPSNSSSGGASAVQTLEWDDSPLELLNGGSKVRLLPPPYPDNKGRDNSSRV